MKYKCTGARSCVNRVRLRKGGISKAQIGALRKQIQVGDNLLVVTQKADTAEYTGRMEGVSRIARVVDTNSNHFCIVEFPKGTKEAVLWTDIMTGKAIVKQSDR